MGPCKQLSGLYACTCTMPACHSPACMASCWAHKQLLCLHTCTPTFPALISVYVPAVARNWDQLAATAKPNFFPLQVWLFVLAAMVAHDAWFFLAHTAMHRFKWVYRHVHAKHHTLGSNCSPLGESESHDLGPGLCGSPRLDVHSVDLVWTVLIYLLCSCRHSIYRCR